MKKLTAMMLCLALLACTPCALAARDVQNMDIEVSGEMQAELNRALGEVTEREVQVHVYASSYDGEKAVLYGDVYACDMEGQIPVNLLPEDAVTWLYHCQVVLEKDLNRDAGYKVAAVEKLSPEYRAGNTAAWQTADNEAYGYSLLLPTGFVLQEEDARHMVWQAEGTEEMLSVDAFENMGYDAMLADFMDAPTGEVVLESREFGYFSTWGDTFYEVYVAMEGTQWGYILRLDFPAERQGEYLFYGEMIRNAFFVWGGAVG